MNAALNDINATEFLRWFNDSVRESSYIPPDEVVRFAETPRFGRTNDIVALLGSQSEKKDYIVGLIFGAALVFCLFVVWLITITALKFLGKEKVGFFAGTPFEETPSVRKDFPLESPKRQSADEWDDDLENEYNKMRYKSHTSPSWRSRPTLWRILFLLSGLVYIIFSILLVTKGLANLSRTVDVFQNSLSRLDVVAAYASNILTDNLRPVSLASEDVYDGLKSEISGDNFCPADPNLDFSPEAQEIQSQAQDAVDQLAEFNDLLDLSILEDLQAVLDQYYSFSEPIASALGYVNLDDWRIVFVTVVVSMVAVLMMAGTLLAMFSIEFPFYGTFLNYILCPLMFLISSVSWIVAGLMLVAAGMNGDFCLPGGRAEPSSPDDTILGMMNATGNGPGNSGGQFDPYMVAYYFIKQCSVGNNPFGFVRGIVPDLVEGQEVLSNLDEIFGDTTALNLISLYCGRDFARVQAVLQQLVDLVTFMLEAAVRVLELVSCRVLVPLYINTVYEGMCTYSPAAVYWVFQCTIVMAVMSSLMLTIRSSYKMTNLVYPLPEGTKDPDDSVQEIDPLDVE